MLRRIGEHGETIGGVRYRNANVVEYDGCRYVFSHRAILTLVVVSSCNAGCKFCSNEITFTPSGPYLHWNDRVERVKDFALLCGVTKVAYSGGEPTLAPQKLVDLVSRVSPGFARSRLHTNGWGLFNMVEHAGESRELLTALVDSGLTGASISVAHHDPQVNRKVMVLTKSWPGMDDAALQEVAGRAGSSFTPRLSCVLTEDGVRDVPDMLDYLEWGRSLGFRRFIFRTCSAIPDGFKKETAFSDYNDVNGRSLAPITATFARRTGAELTFRQRKSDSKVDVYRWGDVTVDIDESSEEVDPDPKVRRLNMMPDGVVYSSWITPTSNIFPDDQPAVEISLARERARGAVL